MKRRAEEQPGMPHGGARIETMIACVNAWQISGNDVYLQSADTVWTFVKDCMIDREYGEWYSDCFDGEPKKDTPKVSMWRCRIIRYAWE